MNMNFNSEILWEILLSLDSQIIFQNIITVAQQIFTCVC